MNFYAIYKWKSSLLNENASNSSGMNISSISEIHVIIDLYSERKFYLVLLLFVNVSLCEFDGNRSCELANSVSFNLKQRFYHNLALLVAVTTHVLPL